MKSIADQTSREELIARINALNDDCKAQWGKMSVFQMLKHCTLWEEMRSGTLPVKRVFIGRIIGKLLLKQELSSDKPMAKNNPTVPELMTAERVGDIISEKQKWIDLINKNATTNSTQFIHPFFGKMTDEQVGYQHYKHVDHHLRQFGC